MLQTMNLANQVDAREEVKRNEELLIITSTDRAELEARELEMFKPAHM